MEAPEAVEAEANEDELSLEAGDELMLGDEDLAAEESAEDEGFAASDDDAGNRPWLTEEPVAAPAPRPQGGTLFERMSGIARGAAKAQVEEDSARTTRDPLEIPRFLNRQNNQ